MELRYLINDRVKTENKVRRVGAVLTNHSHIAIIDREYGIIYNGDRAVRYI